MGFPVSIDEIFASDIGMTLAGVLQQPIPGITGLLSPISFCHWQPDETTNIGNTIWATIFNGAQIAIAVYNAVKQEEIADKQMDLAEHWYDHAQYKWTRFRDNYMPLEKRLLNETSNKPVPKLNCRDGERRSLVSAQSAYTIMNRFFRQQTKKYSLPVDKTLIEDINFNRAIMTIDSRNFNYADDRWYRDFKDDQRWSRRSNILNLGRNLDSMALEYGKIAYNTFGDVGMKYDRAAQGAMQAIGYFGARNDTYLPHSFLGTSGVGESGSLVSTQAKQGGVSPTSISPSSGAVGSAP